MRAGNAECCGEGDFGVELPDKAGDFCVDNSPILRVAYLVRNLAISASLIAGIAVFSEQAQAADSVATATTDTLSEAGEARFGFGNGSIVVAPIPLSNPALGNGVVAGASYLFKVDANSDTSYIGVAKMKTDNGSEGAGIAATILFGQGRWELRAAYGEAKINYSVSGIGRLRFGPIPISQEGTFASAKISYGITESFRLGVQAAYLDTTISLNNAGGFVLPSLPSFKAGGIKQLLIAPTFSWDTRDDNIYPTKGLHASWVFQRGFGLGSFDNRFTKHVLSGSAYVPYREKGVLALNVTACNASSKTPFFNQCAVGLTDNFRGFSAGQYVDKGLLTLQAEYRHRMSKRWGATIFGGASIVGPSFDDLGSSGALYAGGLGARYRLSKKFPLDFSVDLTVNSDGVQYTYVYIGQSF